MSKSFAIVQGFMKEVFECDFFAEPVDERIGRISELLKARQAIKEIIEKKPKSFGKEFMEYVFPILEVALQWKALENSGNLPEEVVEKYRERMTSKASSNFLGAIFEIDIASRCLLSGWKCDFVEDYTGKGKQIDLLIEKPKGQKIGLECTSKRATVELDARKINETIAEKCEKFHPSYLSHLPTKLDKRIVIVDITRKSYSKPVHVLENSDKIEIGNNLSGIVLTWREDSIFEGTHDLQTKYRSLGDLIEGYFSTTWAARFCRPTRERGPVFFLRKHVEPEPQHSEWGLEESCEDYKEKGYK